MRIVDKRCELGVAIVCGLLWLTVADGDAADPAALPPRRGVLQGVNGGFSDVELLELSAEGSRWLDGTQSRNVGARELLAWGRPAAMLPVGRLELVGGAVVAGTLDAWDRDQVVLFNPLFGELAVPRAAVRGWQRRGQRLSNSAVMPGMPSALLLANGDWLVASHLTLMESAFGRERAWIVTPSGDESSAMGAAALRIPADRVVAILHGEQALLQTGPSPSRRTGSAIVEDSPSCIALAGLQDGSWLPVAAITPDDGSDRFLLHPCLPGGIRLPPILCERRAVTSLLAIGEHVLPLAWLEPREFVQEPLFGEPWPLTRGRSLLGGPLVMRGLHGFTGVGLHAPARATYQLPGRATRLLATVAIDDSAGKGGSGLIRIRAGRDPSRATEVFRSPVLRGGELPLAIDVPLDDASWLELTIHPTDDGAVLDRTLWLEPRLLMRQTSRTEAHAP